MRLLRLDPARRLATTVLLGALLIAASAAASGAPAVAAPERSASIPLTVVGGDGQVSAAWTSVPGATGYAVHWGAGSKTNRTVVTRGTSVRLLKVTNRRTYSVRVTAIGRPAASVRRATRPVPYVPTSLTSVSAKPAGPDRIRVTWTGGSQARSVKVLAGADSMTEAHHFSTGWLPAAVRSTVLTVPSRLRKVLGAGTGNVVFVKVAMTNSLHPSRTDGYHFSLAGRYRLTPSGTWSLAGMTRATGASSRLSVATWNVQSVTATAQDAPQNRWANRLPKVVANIEAHTPDVIGLQELTTARIEPACLNPHGRLDCVEQYQTLQSALATAKVPYVNARTDGNAWVYAHPDSYVDSNLFYNPAKLAVEASGFLSPRDLVGRSWPAGQANEAGMWARFRILSSTGSARSFYAVSIHLPAGGLGRLRAAEAAAIARVMDARARQTDGTKLPIVVVGDFNGNGARESDAGSLRLLADGYIDAAATSDRTNLNFSTANQTNGRGGIDADYPAVLTPHPYPTSRIDYVMLKNSPYPKSYRNLVPRSGTMFDSRYQGSDHNMQLAVVGIGDPVR
jgi:endonuclease/exonuclease/phosphatase family metal-dependent hydrolase